MSQQPKIHLSVRVSPTGVTWLDGLAESHRVDRSDVVRAALIVAGRHDAELGKQIEAAR